MVHKAQEDHKDHRVLVYKDHKDHRDLDHRDHKAHKDHRDLVAQLGQLAQEEQAV
jgi:hypothetical protein